MTAVSNDGGGEWRKVEGDGGRKTYLSAGSGGGDWAEYDMNSALIDTILADHKAAEELERVKKTGLRIETKIVAEMVEALQELDSYIDLETGFDSKGNDFFDPEPVNAVMLRLKAILDKYEAQKAATESGESTK